MSKLTSGWVAYRPQKAPSGATLHTPAPLCQVWTTKVSLKETLRQCKRLQNASSKGQEQWGWTALNICPWSVMVWGGSSGEGGLGREVSGIVRANWKVTGTRLREDGAGQPQTPLVHFDGDCCAHIMGLQRAPGVQVREPLL